MQKFLTESQGAASNWGCMYRMRYSNCLFLSEIGFKIGVLMPAAVDLKN